MVTFDFAVGGLAAPNPAAALRVAKASQTLRVGDKAPQTFLARTRAWYERGGNPKS